MNLLKKKVSKAEIFAEYIKILNGVLTLSNRECEVLRLLLEGNNRIDTLNKSHISQANLSRYLSVLKAKGLLVRNEKGKWVVNDIIIPKVTNNKIELTFILELAADENSNKGREKDI